MQYLSSVCSHCSDVFSKGERMVRIPLAWGPQVITTGYVHRECEAEARAKANAHSSCADYLPRGEV